MKQASENRKSRFDVMTCGKRLVRRTIPRKSAHLLLGKGSRKSGDKRAQDRVVVEVEEAQDGGSVAAEDVKSALRVITNGATGQLADAGAARELAGRLHGRLAREWADLGRDDGNSGRSQGRSQGRLRHLGRRKHCAVRAEEAHQGQDCCEASHGWWIRGLRGNARRSLLPLLQECGSRNPARHEERTFLR